MNLTPITDPSGGLSFANEDALMEVPASTAVAVGDVLAVNLATVNSAFILARLKTVTTGDFAPTTDTDTTTFFCVALDAVASSSAIQKIRVRVRGIALAKVDGSGTSVGVGDKLRPVDAATTLVKAAAGLTLTTSTYKTVGIALEAATTSTLKRVLFNGIEGLGVAYSVS